MAELAFVVVCVGCLGGSSTRTDCVYNWLALNLVLGSALVYLYLFLLFGGPHCAICLDTSHEGTKNSVLVDIDNRKVCLLEWTLQLSTIHDLSQRGD